MTGVARNTAVALGFADRPAPRRMRLVSFKLMAKGALRGFATIELPNRLKIIDCPVLATNGKVWATFPAMPQLAQDGRQIKVGDKKQYAAILAWPDRATANRFSEAIVELVRAKYPEALDDEGEP